MSPPVGAVRAGAAGAKTGPAIPDSVVTRPTDNNSNSSQSGLLGVRISSTVEWPSIGAEISGNTSGVTTAYIYRVSDGTLMGSTDISALTGGDTFTVDNVDLSANTDYNVVLDADGATYTVGYYDNPSFPYDSSDGQLSIINGASGQTGTDANAPAIVRVGDVGF